MTRRWIPPRSRYTLRRNTANTVKDNEDFRRDSQLSVQDHITATEHKISRAVGMMSKLKHFLHTIMLIAQIIPRFASSPTYYMA